MFKKHKFQKDPYLTNLENNHFYKYFDETFRKILKRHKLTKEFLKLLEIACKDRYIGEVCVMETLQKYQGVYNLTYYLHRCYTMELLNEETCKFYEILGDRIVSDIYMEYANKIN